MSSSSSTTTKTKPFNPFTSPRLRYRAVHAESDRDLAFIHAIQADAEAQSGSSYGLLRPESLQDSKGFRDYLASKCLLGCIFYLSTSSTSSSSSNNPDDAKNNNDKQLLPSASSPPGIGGEDESCVPVGILALKQNPNHHSHHRWTDVSIDVASEFRGKGYGSEALRWGLWYGFQMAGLHKVQIQAFGFNDGALKLYRSLGFKEEGRLRDHMWFNGGWHDNVILGMLEEEWRDLEAEREKEKDAK